MHRISAPNKRFLKDYHDVLSHHIKCILKSGMMLDEDMNLLMTFWNRNLLQISPKSKRHLILTSVTFATAGLMTSMKLRNFFPLLISIIPTTLQLALRAATRYWRNRYKKNFEKLLSTIRLIHDLNREIGQYYNKRDAAAQNQKLQMDAFNILLKPGEDFLRGAIATLVGIIDEIRKNMLQVCKLVPISEGEFICSLVWNLDELQIYNDTSFNEMQLKFEKLSDLYLLITSNFLSCIGLSFCVQLWKEPCNLPKIFNDVVPHLGNSLCKSLNDIKTNFNLIRFNLHDRDIVKIGNNVSVQLHRPLTDLLLNLQITFETTKHLQVLVEHEQNSYEEYIAILEDINKQVAASRASLSILINRFALLAKRVTVKNECAKELPLDVANKNTDVVEAINCSNNDEDGIYTLEDEEYNLSIHGSDVDDYIDYIEDPADQRSTEDLSVLLLELKRNLMQREGKLGKQAREESGAGDVEKSQPLPPPLPLELPERLPFIPDATDVRGLLRAVTLTAQRLNRAEEFQFGFNMFPEIPRPFNTTYRCFSVAMLPGNERQDVERGGKIIMPPSALEQLTRLNINYPMQFKIVNKNTSRTTHCGVLEFVADEGKVYLPLWMMHNLVLEEGDLLQIESVTLPVGNFAKFQPLSPEFLDITNPKAVLENCLRTFACLTSGDVIAVKYNQRVYELCVLETQPGEAISIIECDMNVEFAAPVGYKETEIIKPAEEGMAVDPADLMPEPAGFVAFRGAGNRLDGKRRKDSGSIDGVTSKPVYVRGIPDYDYQIGTLRFLRPIPKSPEDSKEEDPEFKAFSGEGFSLRQRN